jgi:hypothetical protein
LLGCTKTSQTGDQVFVGNCVEGLRQVQEGDVQFFMLSFRVVNYSTQQDRILCTATSFDETLD